MHVRQGEPAAKGAEARQGEAAAGTEGDGNPRRGHPPADGARGRRATLALIDEPGGYHPATGTGRAPRPPRDGDGATGTETDHPPATRRTTTERRTAGAHERANAAAAGSDGNTGHATGPPAETEGRTGGRPTQPPARAEARTGATGTTTEKTATKNPLEQAPASADHSADQEDEGHADPPGTHRPAAEATPTREASSQAEPERNEEQNHSHENPRHTAPPTAIADAGWSGASEASAGAQRRAEGGHLPEGGAEPCWSSAVGGRIRGSAKRPTKTGGAGGRPPGGRWRARVRLRETNAALAAPKNAASPPWLRLLASKLAMG